MCLQAIGMRHSIIISLWSNVHACAIRSSYTVVSLGISLSQNTVFYARSGDSFGFLSQNLIDQDLAMQPSFTLKSHGRITWCSSPTSHMFYWWWCPAIIANEFPVPFPSSDPSRLCNLWPLLTGTLQPPTEFPKSLFKTQTEE